MTAINVHPRHKALRATQFQRGEDFPEIERCTRNRKGDLEPLGDLECFGPTTLGYPVNKGVYVPIRLGDWIIKAPDGFPLPETLVMSDEEFQRHYIQE